MLNKSYNLSICDISIQYALNGIDSSIEERLLPFLKDNKDYDMKINVDKVKNIEFPKKSIPISVSYFNYVLDNEKNYIWADYCKSALVSSDADWCKVTISATRNMHTHIEESYLLNLLQGNLSKNKGFILHGSVIKYENEGIIFTASSGVGKSTQAELWKKYEKAEIINGDKAFIRCFNDEVMVYGSPWSGSSNIIKNEKAPLKAIIVLEQGKENKIRELKDLEKLCLFNTHVYYPYWDKKLVNLVMETINLVLKRIPVYLLSCKPEKEAVSITKKTLEFC